MITVLRIKIADNQNRILEEVLINPAHVAYIRRNEQIKFLFENNPNKFPKDLNEQMEFCSIYMSDGNIFDVVGNYEMISKKFLKPQLLKG